MSSESERASVGRGRRRRAAITPIHNNAAREVSFTKRRQGLFRKASELAVLCGAEVAIVAYSPHENPFSFGTPSADAVLGRFLGYGAGGSAGAVLRQNEFIMRQEREALSRLGEAKKRLQAAGPGSEYQGMMVERRWWEDPVEGLGLEELEHYVDSMDRLKDTVTRRLEELGKAAAAVPTTTAEASSSSGGSNVLGTEWFDMAEFDWVEKEEEIIIPAGSTSSEVVDPDLDMTVFDSINTEEELVPRGNSLNYNIWDHDFGL